MQTSGLLRGSVISLTQCCLYLRFESIMLVINDCQKVFLSRFCVWWMTVLRNYVKEFSQIVIFGRMCLDKVC